MTILKAIRDFRDILTGKLRAKGDTFTVEDERAEQLLNNKVKVTELIEKLQDKKRKTELLDKVEKMAKAVKKSTKKPVAKKK